MIRRFTPDKCPEEFKKIRAAYEKLSNIMFRVEYDAYLKYGDEIEENKRLGNECLENGNYKMAIKYFKKILIIEPKLMFAKNLLGLALGYNKEYDEAIEKFNELLSIEPENVLYLYNVAFIYQEKGDYQMAENNLLKAHSLKKTNIEIIKKLTELFILQENPDKAMLLLRKCLAKNNQEMNSGLVYYFEMIKVSLYLNDVLKINDILEEIIEVYGKCYEDIKELAFKISEEGYVYVKRKEYNIAVIMLEKAISLDNNEDIIKVYEFVKNLKVAIELYNKLDKEENIASPFKGPIFYYLFNDEFSEEQIEEERDRNLEAIESYIKYDPDEAVKSINNIKVSYRLLYDYRKELYEELLKMALDNVEIGKQFNELDNDYNVTLGIKRLIALWITNDISDNERNEYFKDIIENIANENNNSVIKSISILKSKYGELYNLNPDALEKIRSIAEENNTKENYTSSYSQTNSSSNISNSNSTSGPGFGTLIVCAVIGGIILPGIGFFIGGAIGLYIIGKYN